MKKKSWFLVLGFLGLVGTAAGSPLTDSERLVQKGLDAQKLGKDGLALQWFMMAAQQGNANGQYHVGYCYLSGQGTTLDEATARKWFLKAADQSDGPSEMYLGEIYENGWGVPVDLDAAKNWYQRALQHGSKGAQADLDRLAAMPSPTPSAPLTTATPDGAMPKEAR